MQKINKKQHKPVNGSGVGNGKFESSFEIKKKQSLKELFFNGGNFFFTLPIVNFYIFIIKEYFTIKEYLNL